MYVFLNLHFLVLILRLLGIDGEFACTYLYVTEFVWYEYWDCLVLTLKSGTVTEFVSYNIVTYPTPLFYHVLIFLVTFDDIINMIVLFIINRNKGDRSCISIKSRIRKCCHHRTAILLLKNRFYTQRHANFISTYKALLSWASPLW